MNIETPMEDAKLIHHRPVFWLCLVACAVGLASQTLDLFSDNASVSVASMALCCMPGILALVLHKGPQLTEVVTPFLILLGGTYVSVVVWQRMIMGFSQPVVAEQILAMGPWVPIITLLTFAMLERNLAQRLTLAFYVATGLPIIIFFTFGNGQIKSSPTNYTVMMQMVVTHGFILAIMQGYAKASEHFSTIRKEVSTFKHMATTDALTQLPNRRALEAELTNFLDRSTKMAPTFSIALLDVDHFKKVNDRYGHDVGDRVLQGLARIVEQELREADTFGRWGGEEFLAIFPGCGPGGAEAIANRLRQAIEREVIGGLDDVTASLGVSTYETGDSMRELLRRADQGLYHAKEDGRNCVRWVNANLLASVLLTEKAGVNLALHR